MLKRFVSVGLVSLLGIVLLVSCGQNQKQTNSETAKTVTPANLKKITLDVEGMTCSGCEYNVESALKKVDGVADAKADYKNHKAVVQFDPEVASLDKLVEAVNHSGYSAKASQVN